MLPVLACFAIVGRGVSGQQRTADRSQVGRSPIALLPFHAHLDPGRWTRKSIKFPLAKYSAAQAKVPLTRLSLDADWGEDYFPCEG